MVGEGDGANDVLTGVDAVGGAVLADFQIGFADDGGVGGVRVVGGLGIVSIAGNTALFSRLVPGWTLLLTVTEMVYSTEVPAETVVGPQVTTPPLSEHPLEGLKVTSAGRVSLMTTFWASEGPWLKAETV